MIVSRIVASDVVRRSNEKGTADAPTVRDSVRDSSGNCRRAPGARHGRCLVVAGRWRGAPAVRLRGRPVRRRAASGDRRRGTGRRARPRPGGGNGDFLRLGSAPRQDRDDHDRGWARRHAHTPRRPVVPQGRHGRRGRPGRGRRSERRRRGQRGLRAPRNQGRHRRARISRPASLPAGATCPGPPAGNDGRRAVVERRAAAAGPGSTVERRLVARLVTCLVARPAASDALDDGGGVRRRSDPRRRSHACCVTCSASGCGDGEPRGPDGTGDAAAEPRSVELRGGLAPRPDGATADGTTVAPGARRHARACRR